MASFWHSLPRPILALAPMEGITDSPARLISREHGADVVYTEFISSDAIGRNAQRALEKMRFDPREQPVICQIFGRDPDYFAQSAKEIERRGFAGIDLNFGCPARAVVGSGMGVALLRDPAYARRLIESVLDSISIPLSIKVRASIRKERKEIQPGADRNTALDLIEAIHDLPVAAIMVHGRSFEGGFTETVDTKMIAAVKERFAGIVLANGGIRTAEDAERLLQQTGTDGIGVARGAQGNPWIFRQIRQRLNGRPETMPDWREIQTVMREHADRMLQLKGPHGLLELRKHLAWYVRGLPGAAELRRQLVRVSTRGELDHVLESLRWQPAQSVETQPAGR